MSRTPRPFTCLAPAILLLAAGPALAAEGTGPAMDAQTGELPTLAELFFFSPWVNGCIAALSVLALLLFLFFLATVNPSRMVPADLVDDITRLVVARDYDEAARLCRRRNHVFVASILQRCMENASRGHAAIMEIINSEGRRRAEMVWNRTSYLADISNVAPMLGLLGTVLGMIQAFFALDFDSATAASSTLSRGIAGAMATTLFGLSVGIAALVFHSLVKSRVTRTLAEAERVVHSVTDHVKTEGEAT